MRGGSLQALKEILGHSSMTMVLRYAHLSPEHLRGEMAKTERPPSEAAVVSPLPSAACSSLDRRPGL